MKKRKRSQDSTYWDLVKQEQDEDLGFYKRDNKRQKITFAQDDRFIRNEQRRARKDVEMNRVTKFDALNTKLTFSRFFQECRYILGQIVKVAHSNELIITLRAFCLSKKDITDEQSYELLQILKPTTIALYFSIWKVYQVEPKFAHVLWRSCWKFSNNPHFIVWKSRHAKLLQSVLTEGERLILLKNLNLRPIDTLLLQSGDISLFTNSKLESFSCWSWAEEIKDWYDQGVIKDVPKFVRQCGEWLNKDHTGNRHWSFMSSTWRRDLLKEAKLECLHWPFATMFPMEPFDEIGENEYELERVTSVCKFCQEQSKLVIDVTEFVSRQVGSVFFWWDIAKLNIGFRCNHVNEDRVIIRFTNDCSLPSSEMFEYIGNNRTGSWKFVFKQSMLTKQLKNNVQSAIEMMNNENVLIPHLNKLVMSFVINL